MWVEVEENGWTRLMRSRLPNRVAEIMRSVGIKWNERVTIPVGFEFCDEFAEDVRKILSGDLYIPFQATGHRGLRHV